MQMQMGSERRMNEHFDPLDHQHYCITIESSSSSFTPSKLGGGGGLNFIEHPVSKFDTLAGVAIKYGVEVADIKRMNGLVTDHQMFALKKLRIPLPGRHPPSRSLVDGLDNQRPSSSEQIPVSRRHSDLFDSFQSLKLKPSPLRKASTATSSLQGYYGLETAEQKVPSEGFERAVYQKGGAHNFEDGPFANYSPPSNPPLSHKRISNSVADGFLSENGNLANQETRDNYSDRWIDKLLRRRPKSEVNLNACTPEMLPKEDNSSGCAFSALGGKGLALRPKAASRTVSGADAESGWLSAVPTGLGDSFVAGSFSVVRKSSSTPSLQDSDTSTSASIWSASKWSLKPDLQALSTAAITTPIFDGLSNPITGRKSKAALD